jgi:hypothetical protein
MLTSPLPWAVGALFCIAWGAIQYAGGETQTGLLFVDIGLVNLAISMLCAAVRNK